MTQTPESMPEPPEGGTDVDRAGSPKIQPGLVGFVLAGIIGLITILAFWGR
jgi:hypothetical protein